MRLNRRANAVLMLLLSCAYFLLFVPPNLTGARDANMLAAFQIDEYAQYPVVMRMTDLDAPPLQTLKHFVAYGHYYYGYPFYLASATAILPLRVALKLVGGHPYATMAYMAILRQLSPVFMILAIVILVYMWTGFRSLWKSALLFLFLASIPAVFVNNMWWHPESLVMLFVVLTIFSLDRDERRYGIWFAMAAVFCGLAIGTKMVGFWFFLTVAVYLALGFRRVGLAPTLKRAALFCAFMLLTVIVSNPLLLIPQTARAIIGSQTAQAEMNSFGWGVQMAKGPLAWYAEALKGGFGLWWVYVLALGGCVWGIRSDNKRLLNVIILTWFVPFAVYLLFFVANKATRYFLPALLPMISCIGNQVIWSINRDRSRKMLTLASAAMLLLLLGPQLVLNVRADVNSYAHTLYREQESASIAFYRQLDNVCLQQLPPGTRLTVFRDPYVYLPPIEGMDVRMKWGSADYRDIEGIVPDLILLQSDYVAEYSDPATVDASFDAAQAKASLEFYRDASHNAIAGYRRILETPFGVAFARTGR